MVGSLVYRTDDFSRWGGGTGFDLPAATIDINFWTLYQGILALEATHTNGAGIDFINQPLKGNLFFIHLTDHRVLGPYTIPTARWQPRGPWLPTTVYAAFDVVYFNGTTYLVTIDHTSALVFSPYATDGLGNDVYVPILFSPSNALPSDGLPGMRLVKSSGSPFKNEYLYDLVRMFVFVEGQALPSELLLQFTVADTMTIPHGLTGSVIFERIPALASTTYNLFKNGAAIGQITFSGGSPETVSITFPSDINCIAGDVITMVAPLLPDTRQTDISFTIVAQLKI